jgi:hypothetical protein
MERLRKSLSPQERQAAITKILAQGVLRLISEKQKPNEKHQGKRDGIIRS